ncbi:hypothetical protein [uncultured Cellulomonas sp.]|uniref:hypothetical protein n=1 Tax=uncultured Cellulomonas sp. TaxID=189682 RepID=UPI00260CA403|nr:hypothetical protein [uncultured Cellulomonas sp.]
MKRRGLLLVPGGLALLAGLDAALLLLGLPAPVTTERLPQVHGPLLVLGFVATVVALERAVALRRLWGYAAPAALGVGGLALLVPALPLAVGQVLMVAGTAVQLAVYAALWRRAGSIALATQALGAVAAAGSAVLWLGGAPVATVLPWFTGFLILTIVGERVELARVALPPGAEPRAFASCVVLFAAVVGTSLWPDAAVPLLGAALLAVVGWLGVHDVARRTVRSTGLPRYIAWCLLAGYAWLAVAGAIWLLAGPVTEGGTYDAVVHAVFLGFTLSMVMAHAPVILPAVLGRPLPYRPHFGLAVGLLHASLALRVLVGDAYGQSWALQTGGTLNIVALLTFVAMVATSAARGPRSTAPSGSPDRRTADRASAGRGA